jgi:hypothetical protein
MPSSVFHAAQLVDLPHLRAAGHTQNYYTHVAATSHNLDLSPQMHNIGES